MKRLFVGIPLAEELTVKVESVKSIVGEIDGVRWLAPRNLHITLIPPWESENIAEVITALKAVKLKSFVLEFTSVSLGPRISEPRLIWATGEYSRELSLMRSEIQSAIKNLVYIPLGRAGDNPREFIMHSTLARVKPSFTNLFPKFPMEIDWRMEVREFVLYESILKPTGAEYIKLASFALS